MLSKKIQKKVGILVLATQLFSFLSPIATFAAPQSVSGTDTQNSLETVGTKANRLKTVGSSGVDESSGAFTYSYPISVPKGKNGMEPSLSINYNSQSTENSIVGFGMNLAIPNIERSAKYGVDKIYTKNDFVSTLGGELILKPGTTNEYIQKIDDGSFQNYIFSNNIWTMTDRSGNTYTFGTTLDSRLSNEDGTKIQKYYLTNVKDTLGNQIKYFYEKKNNFVYPLNIVYTQDRFGAASNRVTFEREVRNDSDVSYKSGFKVTMDDRIKSIKMSTDNILVGQVDLGYTTGQNGVRSLLNTVTESRMGTDGVMTSTPQTKFDFQNDVSINKTANVSVQSGQAYQDITGDAKPEYFSLTNGALYGTTWKVLDVNGDYLPDMYYFVSAQTTCNGYCNFQPVSGIYKINIGLGNFSSLPMSSSSFLYSAAYDNLSQAYDLNLSVSDINGDGLQDLTSNTIGINKGSTFSTSTFTNPSFDQLVDVNGDGLPDSVRGTAVYLNNGINWNTASDTKYILPFTQTLLADKNGAQYDAGVRFVDINSDGLVDVVRSYTFSVPYSACSNYTNYCSASANEVYINNGSAWVQNTNINLTNYIVNYSGNIYNWGLSWTTTQYDFSDINSDGSTNGTKQDILKTVTNPLGGKSDITYKGSAIGNNPKLPINMLVVDQVKETESKNNLVETTNYTFENGKMYYDASNIYDRRFAGFGKVTTVKGDQKTIKYFHQGDGDDVTLNERGDSFYNIGKTFKEELWGKVASVDTKFSESYKNFGNYVYGGQIYNYPKYEVNTTYDTNGDKLTKAISYDYDLASRLPKQITNYGEVNFDPTTGTISDIGEDAIITKNIYNTKRPQKLLSEESTDINGKFLDKKVYFYDELPFGYVERGLLTEERNYSSANVYVRKVNFYNDKGQLQTITDNNGNVTTFTYDENNNPISVTNTLGQKVQSETNKWLGVETKNTDANGKIVQTVYDGFGRVKSISATVTNGTVQLITTKNYNYGVGFTETTNIYKDGVIYKVSTNTYDSFGRLVTNAESVGTSSKRVDYVYNNLGQLVSTTYPYDANGILGTYNSSIDTKYIYDSLGRAVQVTQGDNQSYVSYFVKSKITSDNSVAGHQKTYAYNSQNKIISVAERNSGSVYTTKYSWNLLGNLTGITDAEGNVRNFSYDSEGRLLKQEDLHKSTDSTYGVYSYKYDVLGNLLEKTDPTLNKFIFAYDNLYRPVSETTGTLVTNYIYDNCTNGAGKVCAINNSDYTQNYTYKVTGDVASESKVMDGKTFTNTYAYNSLGQVISVTLPDSSTLNYTYDENGKQKTVSLTTVSTSTTQTTNFVNDAKYNIDGTIKEISYGNNTKTCYNYSTSNGGLTAPRLSDIYSFVGSDCTDLNVASSTNLYKESLTYNKGGSIVGNTERFVKDSSDIVSTFTYDELNRLTSSNVLQNNLNVFNNITYSPVGNILSSDSINYSYAGTDYANPHAPTTIGNKNIAYDPNGNVIADGKNQYNWNLKNTLKKQENDKSISEYAYDINGERIKETVKVKGSATETSQYSVINDVYTAFGQATTTKIDTYVSENTFNELNNANLTSENKISMLFALAYETGYPQKVCAGKVTSCQKVEAEKFVGAYLFSKYNIQLTNSALEEMYAVYMGTMLIGNSIGDYAKNISTTTIQNTGVNQYGTNLISYYYQSPTNYSSQNLVSNIDITSIPSGNKVYSYIDLSFASIPGSQLPIDLYINNNLFISGLSNSSTKKIDLSSEITKMKSIGQTNLKFELRYQQGTTPTGNTVYSYLNPMVLNSAEYSYQSKINPTTNIFPALSTTTVALEIASTTNKNLYGYVYKENKIPSLFGINKFISKETFAEMQNLGITYTNLIIYDRLISYSLSPYASCDMLTGEQQKICRKSILVKYLYAITKYEKESELSTYALDEIADVINGELAVPNNVDEYYIVEVKNINTNNVNSTAQFVQQYYPALVTLSGCGVGYFNGSVSGSGAQSLSRCLSIFSLPNELVTRAKEVSKIEIENFSATANISSLKTYLNITNPYQTIPRYPASSDVNNGVNESFSTSAFDYQVGSTMSLDVTNSLLPWIQGKTSANGLRFSSDTNSSDFAGIQINTTGSVLKVTFKKDADQTQRSFVMPLVTNPKDTDTYNQVLTILARIDKDYKAVSGVIISAETYNEIKNTDLLTNDKVVQVFSENEKLQKDDTLAAVWQKINTTYNKQITREALQELSVVNDGSLGMPVDEVQYTFASATTTRVLASLGTTTIKSYLTIGTTTPVTVLGVNYLDVSVQPNFTVFNRNTLENLSLVPGVFSLRSLSDKDIITTKKFISPETATELNTISVSQKSDLSQFTTTIPNFVVGSTTILLVGKMETLAKINSEIIRIKNKHLSREALEEIYYVLNKKLVIPGPDAQIGVPEVPNISKYKLDGTVGSGIKKQDEMRSDKPIFMENIVTSVPGRKGDMDGAYNFGGSGYIKIPNTQPVLGNAAASYSFWMKTGATNNNQAIFGFNSKGTRNFFQIWFSGGKLNPELAWTNSGGGWAYQNGVKNVADNSWHKVDLILENSANVNGAVSAIVKIYVDGVLDTTSGANGFNSGVQYNMSNISNEVNVGQLENWGTGSMQNGYNGQIDEVKFYDHSLTQTEITKAFTDDMSGSFVMESLQTFSRSDFKLLEPIASTTSTYEDELKNNTAYDIPNNDIKIVSDETKGELGLIGITTQQQIVDIMQKTTAVLKDSKIAYFYNYIKTTNNFELSREALEEVYLIYSEKEIFLSDYSQVNKTINKTLDTADTTFTLKQNSAGSPVLTCQVSNIKYTNPNNSVYYDPKNCEVNVTVPTIAGYTIQSAALNFSGIDSLVPVSVGGVMVNENPAGGTINLNNYPSLPGKYVVMFSTPNLDPLTGVAGVYTLGNISLIVNYVLPNQKMDRTNFSDLKNVSTVSVLNNSLQKEIALFTATTSSATTTTLISQIAKDDLAAANITTKSDVDNIFSLASSTLSKESKLYFFYRKVWDTKNIALNRITLEEAWNIYIGKEVFIFNPVTSTTTTLLENVPLSTIASAYTWVNNNTYADADYCYSFSLVGTHCYMDFAGLTKKGTLQNATLNLMYHNETPNGHNVYIGNINENVLPLHKVPITVDSNAKLTIVGGGSGVYSSSKQVDVTNIVYTHLNKTTPTDFDLVLTHIPSENTGTNYTTWWYQRYNGWNGLYGLVNPYLSLTWNITSTTTSTSTLPTFDRSTILNSLFSSTIDSLQSTYLTESGIATTTILGTSTLPVTCNPILENCTNNSTSTATTTTILIDNFYTGITDTVTNIINPYNYAYTQDGNGTITYILPNGATTTDPYTKIYNTIAKNLNSNTEDVYVKYYPSSYYEYDNRGVNTINIYFNGKVVGTYKYNDISTLSEVSYVHNDYLATPKVITNSMGSTTEVIKRDAWGSMLNDSYDNNEVMPTSFGLSGHKWDENSSLTYSHARYLNNTNRVWLSNDPMSITGFNSDYFILNPQFQNSYSYASQNPINNVDPDGRKVEWVTRELDRGLYGGYGSATHSYLKIAPDVQSDFPDYVYSGIDVNNKKFFTISVTAMSAVDTLRIVYNYERDVNTSLNGGFECKGNYCSEKKVYPVSFGQQGDTESINKIITQVDSYKQDGKYILNGMGGSANCNEITNTLVTNAGGSIQGNSGFFGVKGTSWGDKNLFDFNNYPKSSGPVNTTGARILQFNQSMVNYGQPKKQTNTFNFNLFMGSIKVGK